MAIMKEDDNRQEEELIIVETEPTELDDQVDVDTPDDDEAEDERVRTTSDDDTGEDRKAIQERRRKEKLERKDRRDRAIERDRIEREFLLKRNEDLERRLSAQEQRAQRSDINSLDYAIVEANKEVEMADRVIARAIEAQNGDDVAEALKYRDQARLKIQHLYGQKQQAENQAAQPRAPQIDDRVMRRAQEFIKENPWYDSHGRDEDSAIVIAIDRSLAKDGYDPTSDEYWAELKKRAARRLPERFEPQEKRVAKGGPAVGSGREHVPTSTRKDVYINPERKKALQDLGVWDNDELRNKFVKRYAQFDKENKA